MTAESPHVLTSSSIEQKLTSLVHGGTRNSEASIVGVVLEGVVALLDVSILPQNEGAGRQNETSELAAGCISSWLPMGLSIVGIAIGKDVGTEEDADQSIQEAISFQKSKSSPSIYAILLHGAVSYWTATSPAKRLPAKIESPDYIDKWLDKHFLLLHLRLSLSLKVILGPASKDRTAPVQQAFKALKSQLHLESAAFLVDLPSSEGKVLLDGDNADSLMESSSEGTDKPLNVQLVVSSHDSQSAAPLVTFMPFKDGPQTLQSAKLSISILAYTARKKGIGRVSGSDISAAISKQLDAAQAVILSLGEVSSVTAFTFRPPGSCHYYTLLYPVPEKSTQDSRENQADLISLRKWLHARLFLPADRPLLRVSNAVQLSSQENSPAVQLQDVHRELKFSGVKGGTQHLVWGSYSYYHYMQDGVNDSGWGCAYRSLQTICSWFRHQHMTSKPIPSHREIQQTLVDIGDKERGFVGSEQWIGAIEIGFVIETLLGVTAKVITVSKGVDIDQKARELADHFDKQGTPVMIGGGVLAYTLLGVDYNAATGECAYLILDPHYTGADDLKKIQKGQWVGWKKADSNASAGGKLFVKDAFYNLLCPQRPSII